MSYRIRIAPAAAEQIRAANAWWLANRQTAPEAFAEEIQRGFEFISALPNAGEPVAHRHLPGLRRLLLGRIRYFLYYSSSPDKGAVDVLALWHAARGTPPPVP